ncbi:Dopa 4,5-dioxygenase [Halotydeus destructor]|nr:Dopa 4,5-dioxygenase [Halotydeus destructor]
MKFIAVALCVVFAASAAIAEDYAGYHFHTYYFQDNAAEKTKASNFRQQIIDQVISGAFPECHVNRFNERPIGPHPIGSFETCCNSSSLTTALSWFMMNRGDLSVLLHPLTANQYVDHTRDPMWLGQPVPLDYVSVVEPLPEAERCPNVPSGVQGHS